MALGCDSFTSFWFLLMVAAFTRNGCKLLLHLHEIGYVRVWRFFDSVIFYVTLNCLFRIATWFVWLVILFKPSKLGLGWAWLFILLDISEKFAAKCNQSFFFLSWKFQNILGKNGVKERILQRIEPWIRRELQAILGDADPSIIVHVATSIYMSSLEMKVRVSSGQPDIRDDFLAPLKPFLLDKTDMFWHELR